VTRVYRIGVVAQRTGLSEEVIRAWERRYGVPRPQRTRGGYRVYSEDDVALLARLRDLTREGMAIREAAALVPQLRRELAGDARPATNGDRSPVDRFEAAILAAAAALDQEAVERVLDEALAVLSPLQLYDQLVVRLEARVGERSRRGTPGIAEERLVTQAIRGRLLALLRVSPSGTRGHVVCACLPDEEHDVGLLGAALRFRHAGWRVTFLGARTPVAHLLHVATTLRAKTIALGCVIDPGAAKLRRVLAAVRGGATAGTRILVGGAAAVQHATLCRRAGAIVVDDDASWAQALAG
jgi:DNA-binding transcriptional MerR regulator/methylmalonyl-CoA mutase cobalamin-binding subunit